MSDTTITLRGRVGTDLAATRTRNGQTTVRFRLGVTNWFASADGVLTQGRTRWYTIRAWERLAENAFTSLRKGEPVIVVGRPTAGAWISKEDGQARSELVITAQAIGHDLANGRTSFVKAERHWPERENLAEAAGGEEAEPVGVAPEAVERVIGPYSSGIGDEEFLREERPYGEGEPGAEDEAADDDAAPSRAPEDPLDREGGSAQA